MLEHRLEGFVDEGGRTAYDTMREKLDRAAERPAGLRAEAERYTGALPGEPEEEMFSKV